MGGITRRDLFKLSVGAASFAVYSGLGVRGCRKAYAVAGIDDAVLGGLVLLVATLGGYAVSRSVANVSLDALGYGFSDFVSDASNQTAAVTQAIADANNLGVELNRSNAESAAQSIAAGTGYFAEVMGDAATSGRVALDNFISGAGELPGVLRSLIGNFVEDKLSETCNLLPGCTTNSDLVNVGGTAVSFDDMDASLVSADSFDNIVTGLDSTITQDMPAGMTWAIIVKTVTLSNQKVSYYYFFGNEPVTMDVRNGGGTLYLAKYNNKPYYGYYTDAWHTPSTNSVPIVTNSTYSRTVTVSGNLVSGRALPAVDRAVDAPDVIGPGYDSLPLANDLVIDPSTNDVVSAGSLPLPTGIPDVFGDYVGTLNDILAGVVPGTIGLPVSISEPVVVGTAEGVQSMSISDAIAADTSLAATVTPTVPDYPPFDPVEPPTEVPDGPWTPAVTLPFERIWPFNMIYSFVQLFDDLGGA